MQRNSESARLTLIVSFGLAILGVVVLVIALPVYYSNLEVKPQTDKPTSSDFENAMQREGIQTDSGYVEVYQNAFMFWALYYQDDRFRPSYLTSIDPVPLIIWLQSGPGAASTGYGLFEEIGPLDLNLMKRETSWIGLGHVLFIDQPVGTGYSYATVESSIPTSTDEAGKDLLILLKGFYFKHPELTEAPLYIFCQSYGAKFAVSFAEQLSQQIKDGRMDVNFKGVGLGSGYVSPEDSVMSWADYLHHWSLLDQRSQAEVLASANLAKDSIDNGQWLNAYNKKLETQQLVEQLTDNVNVYNILYPHYPEVPVVDPYEDLMMNQVPAYFSIPSNVVWGSQRSMVEQKMEKEFMKPVIDKVDALLLDGVKVVVYNGMLDMLVSTPGQEAWVEKLSWPELRNFLDKRWTTFLHHSNGDTAAFWKSQENFKFWWMLEAGHDIPVDQPDLMLRVLHDTCST